MRVAYADPPYPGQAKRLYGDHPDFAGEVDHRNLLNTLAGYDGWVLHTGSEPMTIGRGLAGAKPDAVCYWAFEVAGFEPDDELDDLYPGTGAVGRAWEGWRRQLRITKNSHDQLEIGAE